MEQKIQKLSDKFLKKNKTMKYKEIKRKYISLEIKDRKKSESGYKLISNPIKNKKSWN